MNPKVSIEFKRRDKDLYKLGYKSYAEYLSSPLWQEIRKAHYSQPVNRICFICGSDQGLALHHMQYVNLGNVSNEHIFTVCSKCHKDIHQWTVSSHKSTRQAVMRYKNRYGRTAWEKMGGTIGKHGMPGKMGKVDMGKYDRA